MGKGKLRNSCVEHLKFSLHNPLITRFIQASEYLVLFLNYYCYFSFFQDEQFLYMVMELCSGGNLLDLVQDFIGPAFPEDWARFYAAEMILGVEALHQMG